ncbi:anti-FecI sigma factor, FecR [Burkholderia sp. lig30]|jgi:transmembrane sensor|uniref:FecR family protein n=1 Tax=Burkholderia sp. lig30 TaxID=1192124 RepID=UPI000461185A|nr:FecR domain-containing protein [Burkholderia sp. lig30]KDB08119.1 anti-FecI sigma factor, FecR [Burkholderia sp. lig30]
MMKPEPDSANDAHDTASAWLVRLRSGNASPAEAQAFEHWCDTHPRTAHELRDTWGSLRTAAAEIAQEERAQGGAWTGVPKRERAMRTGRRAFVGFAVAAGASWLALRPPLGLWPSLGEFADDYRTGTGEQRQVALESNVTIEMNTQTRLDLLSSSAGRGIRLVAGEAEIDAAPRASDGEGGIRPVTVVAGSGRLRARVARFNVRRTDGQVCVTCLSGTVALDHPRGRRLLDANQQVTYDEHGVQTVAPADPAAVSAWRRGMLVFNDMPLSSVVDEINRYRRGRVILRSASLGENRIQAQFPLNRLDDAIDMVGHLYGAHVTRLPGNIVLLS